MSSQGDSGAMDAAGTGPMDDVESLRTNLKAVRQRSAILKRAYVQEQQRVRELEKESQERQEALHRALEESDRRQFQNKRLAKRLQDIQKQAQQSQKSSSGISALTTRFGLSGGVSKGDGSVDEATKQELEAKIAENEELHMWKFGFKKEHEEVVRLLETKLSKVKADLSAAQVSVNEKEVAISALEDCLSSAQSTAVRHKSTFNEKWEMERHALSEKLEQAEGEIKLLTKEVLRGASLLVEKVPLDLQEVPLFAALDVPLWDKNLHDQEIAAVASIHEESTSFLVLLPKLLQSLEPLVSLHRGVCDEAGHDVVTEILWLHAPLISAAEAVNGAVLGGCRYVPESVVLPEVQGDKITVPDAVGALAQIVYRLCELHSECLRLEKGDDAVEACDRLLCSTLAHLAKKVSGLGQVVGMGFEAVGTEDGNSALLSVGDHLEGVCDDLYVLATQCESKFSVSHTGGDLDTEGVVSNFRLVTGSLGRFGEYLHQYLTSVLSPRAFLPPSASKEYPSPFRPPFHSLESSAQTFMDRVRKSYEPPRALSYEDMLHMEGDVRVLTAHNRGLLMQLEILRENTEEEFRRLKAESAESISALMTEIEELKKDTKKKPKKVKSFVQKDEKKRKGTATKVGTEIEGEGPSPVSPASPSDESNADSNAKPKPRPPRFRPPSYDAFSLVRESDPPPPASPGRPQSPISAMTADRQEGVDPGSENGDLVSPASEHRFSEPPPMEG